MVASFFVIESVIRFIDMFSGIGGFREGLTQAGGFTCVGHCEIDKYANRSYNALFDTKGEWFIEDARKADPSAMPDFQLLCGGFPCQTFSILFIRGERPVVDLKYNLLKHPNIRNTEDGGAAPYDYTAADNARDDLPGAPENYELLDMDDFLPAEAAEMKPTIQRIRRPK